MRGQSVAAFPANQSGPTVDPNMPAKARLERLLETLPPALQAVLAAGDVKRRPRFSEHGFDGLSETWSPPASVSAQHASMAQRALDELLMTVLRPVGSDQLLARVLALLSHFPAKDVAPEVERLLALDWADDLGEYPAWAVDAAARTWRRSKKWRPSIAEMRGLCEELCSAERALAERLVILANTGRVEQERAGKTKLIIAAAVRRMW